MGFSKLIQHIVGTTSINSVVDEASMDNTLRMWDTEPLLHAAGRPWEFMGSQDGLGDVVRITSRIPPIFSSRGKGRLPSTTKKGLNPNMEGLLDLCFEDKGVMMFKLHFCSCHFCIK